MPINKISYYQTHQPNTYLSNISTVIEVSFFRMMAQIYCKKLVEALPVMNRLSFFLLSKVSTPSRAEILFFSSSYFSESIFATILSLLSSINSCTSAASILHLYKDLLFLFEKIDNQLPHVRFCSFLDLYIHHILDLVASSCSKLFRLDCLAVFVCQCLTNHRLFEHLCLSEYFLISFRNKIVNQLVFVCLLTVTDPLFEGGSGELFHKDVPVVQVGIHFTIGISWIKSNLLFMDSRNKNILASELPGKVLLLR